MHFLESASVAMIKIFKMASMSYLDIVASVHEIYIVCNKKMKKCTFNRKAVPSKCKLFESATVSRFNISKMAPGSHPGLFFNS